MPHSNSAQDCHRRRPEGRAEPGHECRPAQAHALLATAPADVYAKVVAAEAAQRDAQRLEQEQKAEEIASLFLPSEPVERERW